MNGFPDSFRLTTLNSLQGFAEEKSTDEDE
jgi:hypothetical protein